MMTDIVERLRVGICYQQCRVKDTASGCECAEAADEIEFLREGKKLIIWQHRDATARIEQLEKALRGLIAHTCDCERELTEDLHHVEFCGESLPLTNARAILEAKPAGEQEHDHR